MSNFYVPATRGNTIRLMATFERRGAPIPMSSILNVWFRAVSEDGSLNILKTLNNGVTVYDNAAGKALIVIEDTETAALQKETQLNSSVKILENDGTATTVSKGMINVAIDAAEVAA